MSVYHVYVYMQPPSFEKRLPAAVRHSHVRVLVPDGMDSGELTCAHAHAHARAHARAHAQAHALANAHADAHAHAHAHAHARAHACACACTLFVWDHPLSTPEVSLVISGVFPETNYGKSTIGKPF